MISSPHTPSVKSQIYIIGFTRLNKLIHSLVDDYSDSVDFYFTEQSFEDALKTARTLVREGKVDAFVSAGANAAYLRDNVGVPVVSVKVDGFDMLSALLKARQESNRIGMISYKTTNSDVESAKNLLNIEIEQRAYTSVDQVRECICELSAKGFKVIVGSSIVVDLAEREGLIGILLYSQRSARQALEDAIQIASVKKQEVRRRERLNTIIGHLKEGVVAVDIDEQIELFNPAMEKLLGIPSDRIIGRKLSNLSPVLRLDETLKTGVQLLEQTHKVGHKTVIVNRIPIRERGVVTGAVLTFQDSQSILRADRSIRSQAATKHNSKAKYVLDDIVGRSASILEAKSLAKRFSKIDSTVLITGDTGTGKELIAHSMHLESSRRDNPFVAINCGAFPASLLESELFGYEEGAFTGSRRGGKQGLFEAAHTGTIFLDEISEIPLQLQTHLLRVLQEKEIMRVGSYETTAVDFRVIAATNRNLKDCIAKGTFRPDLFYRLNVLRITLTPLRQRMEDLPIIAGRLFANSLKTFKSECPPDRFLQAMLPYLQNYDWAGNVRELENVIERLVVCFGDLTEFDAIGKEEIRSVVPEIFEINTFYNPVSTQTSDLKSTYKANEWIHIQSVIEECKGNHVEAALRLGISRTTLWRKLKELKEREVGID
ncbi:MAG: propionate catabolism operon regulatory protein PrpR [Betaproteobacteria bacterium]|nr:propionate catabolism operon regulatory protein PrpR [Betaproteobacteria bacterium]